MNALFDDADIISTYPLERAIEDGVLVEIFKDQWETLSNGLPIVATTHLYTEAKLEQLQMVWDQFVYWRRYVKDTLPEAEQLFTTTLLDKRGNDKKVWVIEDGAAITLMYPEDY